MLVLGRAKNEEVEIWTSDGVVVVRFVRHDRGRATLAFEAPPSVEIHRKEVADAIRAGRP